MSAVGPVLHVAGDVLREARSRKWMWALVGLVTLQLTLVGFALRLDVVDGAIAATRLFGSSLGGAIVPAEVALRPVFVAAVHVIFHAGVLLGAIACADFAPALLTPGRIELLLSMPVARWQLLLGTYLGVLALAAGGILYGAGGLVVILGLKTGVWAGRAVAAGLGAVLAFSAIYAAMVAAAVLRRSAALGTATAFLVYVLAQVASARDAIGDWFSPGIGRSIFRAVTLLPPRIGTLSSTAADWVAHRPVAIGEALALAAATAVFAAALLALAMGLFARKDY